MGISSWVCSMDIARTPAWKDGCPSLVKQATLDFASYRWQQHCRGLYQTPIAA
jgi:hypothetical protein